MKHSVAARQFPQVVWQDGKKMLWNPIQRKRLKNRPEERVRLRIVEYLLHGGWSKHRISCEESVATHQPKNQLRSDLICYTQKFDPYLLVECKAEQVKITGQTADQIARYNKNIEAPYLLMTNGVRDFWYSINEGDTSKLKIIPAKFPQQEHKTEKTLDYWKKRGFAGEKALPQLRKWLEKTLGNCMLQDQRPPRHLAFAQAPVDLDLNNYYLIVPQKDYKLALTFSSTPFGGSRLIGIINNTKNNIGLIEINLDLLFDERAPNATLYSADGAQNIDAAPYIEPYSDPFELNDLATRLHPMISKILAQNE